MGFLSQQRKHEESIFRCKVHDVKNLKHSVKFPSATFQKPGNHPNFRKNALGVKRPFSELWERSGIFSEQLSELEIQFSEYEIPFSEWPLTT